MTSDALPAGPFTGVRLPALTRALRDGTVDPVELTRRTLAAVHASQRVLNAFVTVDDEGALAAAATARDELARGVDRGALHGVPVAVKDLIDTAGVRTTMGSRHFADHVPATDAAVVRRLREAGAVVVGKTTTHEYAYGPTGDVSANGACANPHDPSRMAGGSSAGSAAAVGAGLVPLAVGTDTGGSVRIPAALCGVVGIRPSLGLVATDGVFLLSWTLDSVGVLAPDVATARLGLRVLAGRTRAELAQVELAPVELARVRVGRPVGAWFDRLDPTVQRGLDCFAERLAGRGVTVSTVDFEDAAELAGVYGNVAGVEAVSIHHDRLCRAPDLFAPETLERLRGAERIPARDYAVARRRLDQARRGASARLAGLDALLLATVPVLAPPLGARDAVLGGAWASPREALLSQTALWGVLGLPALSIPVSAGDATLPVGAQLVGLPGGDDELVALALALEAVALEP